LMMIDQLFFLFFLVIIAEQVTQPKNHFGKFINTGMPLRKEVCSVEYSPAITVSSPSYICT
jgi:hypothetical protein